MSLQIDEFVGKPQILHDRIDCLLHGDCLYRGDYCGCETKLRIPMDCNEGSKTKPLLDNLLQFGGGDLLTGTHGHKLQGLRTPTCGDPPPLTQVRIERLASLTDLLIGYPSPSKAWV